MGHGLDFLPPPPSLLPADRDAAKPPGVGAQCLPLPHPTLMHIILSSHPLNVTSSEFYQDTFGFPQRLTHASVTEEPSLPLSHRSTRFRFHRWTCAPPLRSLDLPAHSVVSDLYCPLDPFVRFLPCLPKKNRSSHAIAVGDWLIWTLIE